MSRIHEALKKAEQERAAVQTVGAADILAATLYRSPAGTWTIRSGHRGASTAGCGQGGGNDGRLPAVR